MFDLATVVVDSSTCLPSPRFTVPGMSWLRLFHFNFADQKNNFWLQSESTSIRNQVTRAYRIASSITPTLDLAIKIDRIQTAFVDRNLHTL